MEFNVQDRVTFSDELETMEVDFSDLSFIDAQDIDTVYDMIQNSIDASGKKSWYFLVNYKNCDIAFSARPAHSRRGSRMNFSHSLGTFRFDGNQRTRDQIANRPNQSGESGDFHPSRDAATAEIAKLRAQNPQAQSKDVLPPSKYTIADFETRVAFLDDQEILDVDFNNFSFDTSSDVNSFYDYIEDQIEKTGKKWYFLVNYDNTKITMKAFITYAQRGKNVNIASSLGSVRYDASPETEAQIRERAEKQDFSANLCASREDALVRIEEMKQNS